MDPVRHDGHNTMRQDNKTIHIDIEPLTGKYGVKVIAFCILHIIHLPTLFTTSIADRIPREVLYSTTVLYCKDEQTPIPSPRINLRQFDSLRGQVINHKAAEGGNQQPGAANDLHIYRRGI